MKIVHYNLTGTNKYTLKTEILYSIASARSQKTDLLWLKIITSDGVVPKTRQGIIERELRQAKKAGQLQLFVDFESLDIETTETEYLKNKFPELFDINRESGVIIVKL